MIKKIESGITMCQMGQGTLFGGVVKDDEGNPRGVAFTNKPSDLKNGVVFAIDSIEGIAGFMLPVIDLMEEWHKSGMTSGDENEIAEFLKGLEGVREMLGPFRPKAK